MKKIILLLTFFIFAKIIFAESFEYNIFTDCTDVTHWFFRDADQKRCEVKLENICRKELTGKLADRTFATKKGVDYILGECVTSEKFKLKAGAVINLYNLWASNADVDFYNHYRFSSHEKTDQEKERAASIDRQAVSNVLQLGISCKSLGGDIADDMFDVKNADNIYVMGKCKN
ncbi:MAG: hypothetical protein NTY22_05725 [Proteobacteria bacterium]|nr:hypothetical protein [Pseudomonadota bacterium]